MKHIVPGILMMLLALMTVQVSTTAPADAATCSSGSCTNKGPVATGCSSSSVSTLDTVTINSTWGPMTARLMFSAGCQAFWVRGKRLFCCGSAGSGSDGADYEVKVEKRRQSDNYRLYKNVALIPSRSGGIYETGWNWTNMAGRTAGTKFRACVRRMEPLTRWKCTAYWQ